MSWTMIMIRTKTNSETIYEIKSENIIPFRQTEIADAIKKISTELGVDYNCDNLSCQYLGGGIGRDSWQIEFLVGKDAETESVGLNLRGLVDWNTVFAALISELNTRLIDGPTGDFIS